MKVLVDTNVILDLVLEREAWVGEAAQLLSMVEGGRLEGSVAGHAITTVYYVVQKTRDDQTARQAVSDLLDILTVVPPTDPILRRALSLPLKDFEDAVQAACALKIGVDYIVTRNARDFEGTDVPAEPPGAVLAQL